MLSSSGVEARRLALLAAAAGSVAAIARAEPARVLLESARQRSARGAERWSVACNPVSDAEHELAPCDVRIVGLCELVL